MNAFLNLPELMPNQPLDSATTGTVAQFIRQVLPDGEITNIMPVFGLGVSGQAQLFRFNHHNGHHPKPLVAKIGTTVGLNEHRGRKLLISHLPLAVAEESNQPDIFIYEFIPGTPLHQVLYESYPLAERHLQSFVQANIMMWRQTLVEEGLDVMVGYPTKIDSTLQLALNYRLGSCRFGDFADLPVVVNSKPLPSFNQCFQRVRELIISQGKKSFSALQHGDEGSSNFIVQEDNQKHFFIDNGTAGQRLLAEGVAKLIMWWAVTAPAASVAFETNRHYLKFNYQLKIPDRVFSPVNWVIDNILAQLHDYLDYQQLAACLGIYCLREIQWAKKRGNNLGPALLAMAFDAFAGMFDNWLYFPGLDLSDLSRGQCSYSPLLA